jgi:hypothetical protein
MATIGTAVTYMDFVRRTDPNGKIAKIVELLHDTNEILQDVMVVEGNLEIGHRTTVRTGIPSATWRKLNYGVQPAKSTTRQVTDSCGLLETMSEIDEELARLNGNGAEFRLSEDRAILEGMNQQMAETLFYGDTDVYPERFMGLMPRYTAGSTDKDNSGYNVLTGSGSSTDNTSIWLVVWGQNTVHALFPKGTQGGFSHSDLGLETKTLSDGSMLRVLRSQYKWRMGLTVRDWRYAVRIANIDVSNLLAESSAADLQKLMIKAMHRIPNLGMGKAVFYANRDVITMLDIQTLAKSNLHLSYADVQGKPILTFRGIPVRRCDALLGTEATVGGTFA